MSTYNANPYLTHSLAIQQQYHDSPISSVHSNQNLRASASNASLIAREGHQTLTLDGGKNGSESRRNSGGGTVHRAASGLRSSTTRESNSVARSKSGTLLFRSKWLGMWSSWKETLITCNDQYLIIYKDSTSNQVKQQIALQQSHLTQFHGSLVGDQELTDLSTKEFSFTLRDAAGYEFGFKAKGQFDLQQWLAVIRGNIRILENSAMERLIDPKHSTEFMGEVLKVGWIYEKGINKSWTARYLVLSEERIMIFNKPPIQVEDMHSAAVSIPILECKCRALEPSEIQDFERVYCFLLMCNAGNIFCSVDTKADSLSWVSAIKAASMVAWSSLKIREYPGVYEKKEVLLQLSIENGISLFTRNTKQLIWSHDVRHMKSYAVGHSHIQFDFGAYAVSRNQKRNKTQNPLTNDEDFVYTSNQDAQAASFALHTLLMYERDQQSTQILPKSKSQMSLALGSNNAVAAKPVQTTATGSPHLGRAPAHVASHSSSYATDVQLTPLGSHGTPRPLVTSSSTRSLHNSLRNIHALVQEVDSAAIGSEQNV